MNTRTARRLRESKDNVVSLDDYRTGKVKGGMSKVERLKHIEELISEALANEDGKTTTMKQIIGLLQRRDEELDNGFFGDSYTARKSLRDGILLSAKRKETYTRLLAAIRKERERLERKAKMNPVKESTLDQAGKLRDDMDAQRAKLAELVKSLRAQPWWKSRKVEDRVRRKRVVDAISEIETKMANRDELATALIRKLRAEIMAPTWDVKAVKGMGGHRTYWIVYRETGEENGLRVGQRLTKEFRTLRAADTVADKLNRGGENRYPTAKFLV